MGPALGDGALRACSVALAATLVLVASEPCKDTNNTLASEMDLLDQLTDPCRYDKTSRPSSAEPTRVFVHLHVYSIGTIDVQNLRYSAQILFRYRWSDPRLRAERDSVIGHEGAALDRVWSPHLYIVNEQESAVMGSSQKDIMHYLQPDGSLVYLARMKVVIRCVMDLKKFPFDKQRCPLVIESWRYNAEELQLSWEQEYPVTIDKHLQMPEYSLVDVVLNTTSTQYGHRHDNINDRVNIYFRKDGGNFSTLTVHFTLQRQYGYYIMDFYMPSILIVAVSWVTFWLDANSVPGRTVIGTSTMLTFITLSRNMESSLPKVSYVKSSEIWFIACTGFIFGSLAEFAFVNIIYRRRKNVGLRKKNGKHILKSTVVPGAYKRSRSYPSLGSLFDSQHGCSLNSFQPRKSLDSIPEAAKVQPVISIAVPSLGQRPPPNTSLFTMTPQEVANWIDRRSRLFFPLAFLVFNILYWTWTFVLF